MITLLTWFVSDAGIGGRTAAVSLQPRLSQCSDASIHVGRILVRNIISHPVHGEPRVDPQDFGGCGPRLNPEKPASEWLGKPNGPKAKLANEKPKGVTADYDELIKRWAKR